MPLRAPGRPVVVSAALAAATCLPEERPYWLIDHTDALAMRFEVVERGPYGSLVPPSGGPVLEVMPGDRVRVAPFIAGPAGPVAAGSLDPLYYACQGNNCGFRAGELVEARPCKVVAVPVPETCLIGGGEAVEFEVGPILDLIGALTAGASILMIAGTPEGPDTRECVRRLAERGEQAATLRDCLLFSRQVRVGPMWRALLVMAATGGETPIAPDAVPWQVSTIEPDVPPTIAGFAAWVPAPGGGERRVELGLGERLSVKTGDSVELSLVVGAAPQEFVSVSFADQASASVSVIKEVRAAAWFSSAPEPFDLTSSQGLDVTWTAPSEPGEVHVYALLADVRSADVAWLRVEVEPR